MISVCSTIFESIFQRSFSQCCCRCCRCRWAADDAAVIVVFANVIFCFPCIDSNTYLSFHLAVMPFHYYHYSGRCVSVCFCSLFSVSFHFFLLLRLARCSGCRFCCSRHGDETDAVCWWQFDASCWHGISYVCECVCAWWQSRAGGIDFIMANSYRSFVASLSILKMV